MITGIIGIVIGWMCFGPVLGIVAIVLGAVALSQIKKSPERVGGKQLAWVGVVTGSLSLFFYLGLMLIYAIIAIISASTH